MDQYLNFQLIRSRRRRKTISLQIKEEGRVVIYVPYHTPKGEIEKFIKEKQSWIVKKISEKERSIEETRRVFITGEKFFYLGELYPLEIGDSHNQGLPLKLSFGKFILDKDNLERARDLFILWYQREAKEKVEARVRYFSNRLQLAPKGLKITSAKYRWGSCSRDNRLFFSWRIIKIAQDAHDRAVEQTAALEKQKRDREGAIDEIGGKLQKLRQRGGEIKTNKEYQAHLKQIEAVQAELTRAEDEFLALMEALDAASTSVRDARNVLSAAQQEQEEARKALDRDRKILEDEAASLRGQRKDLVESVDRDTYRRYMEILKLGRGLAVVEAKHEICRGCNLHIPPQLFVEIKPNTEIIQCPQCRRILYFSRSEEGDGPHEASPATT